MPLAFNSSINSGRSKELGTGRVTSDMTIQQSCFPFARLRSEGLSMGFKSAFLYEF